MKYEDARRIMQKATGHWMHYPTEGKVIGNNTTLRYNLSRDCFSVHLHGNEILKIFPDRFEPSDAGYKTVTTKARLNDFMPMGHVFQRNNDWYMTIGDTTYDWDDVIFVSTLDENYGEVMLYSTHPMWPSQVQEIEV